MRQYVSQRTFTYDGQVEMSKPDADKTAEAITIWLFVIRDLTTSAIPFRVAKGSLPNPLSLGGMVTVLKAIANDLRRYYNGEDEAITPYATYRATLEVQWPLNALKSIWYRLQHRDDNALRFALTYCEFVTRIFLSDQDRTSQNVLKYLNNEIYLRTLRYDKCVVNSLKQILREWLWDFSTNECHPHHGSGATAELSRKEATLENKYRLLRMDRIMMRVLPNVEELIPYGAVNRTCRGVFVPKTATTDRFISAEPTSLAYWQHFVSDAIRACLKKSDARLHIDFNRQELSRELARRGSIKGDYDTIDLSDASDTVTWKLVKAIFPARVLKYLLATRSTTVDVDGIKIRLAKFAPMGSDCCFTVETLVFSAVCEHVARGITHGPKYYRVYGDDIVCARTLTDGVIETLSRLGFKVNSSKSFKASCWHNFREACGGEYHNNCDVTPLRLSRKFAPVTMSADSITAMIDLINRLTEWGCFRTRRMLIEVLQNEANLDLHYQAFSWDGTQGIMASPLSSSINSHLDTRLGDCQCPEYLVMTTDAARDYGDDYYRYIEYWHRPQSEYYEPVRVGPPRWKKGSRRFLSWKQL